MRLIQRLTGVLVALALMAQGAIAEGNVSVEERGLELAESSVKYPAVTGLADETLEKQVNDQIIERCGIRHYLAQMSMLISGGSLQVEWIGGMLGDVFSCAVSASGQVSSPRNTFVWTACTVDLRTGESIGWDQLFTNGEKARQMIEDYLEEQIAPEMSAHLLNSELIPLPETFFIEKAGVTLLYPLERLSTLSGRAGGIRISWNELREALNPEEDGVPDRAGAWEMITLTAESAEKIFSMAAQGQIEGIPARIGDSIKAWTDRMHLLTDPDVYRDGRLFSLEGASFQDAFLMTDHLSESWEESLVEGIRMDRGCAYGLCIGETVQEDWRAVLGEPAYTITVDPETAEAYRTVSGTCDYYSCGDHQLLLYADEEGVLASLIVQ